MKEIQYKYKGLHTMKHAQNINNKWRELTRALYVTFIAWFHQMKQKLTTFDIVVSIHSLVIVVI